MFHIKCYIAAHTTQCALHCVEDSVFCYFLLICCFVCYCTRCANLFGSRRIIYLYCYYYCNMKIKSNQIHCFCKELSVVSSAATMFTFFSFIYFILMYIVIVICVRAPVATANKKYNISTFHTLTCWFFVLTICSVDLFFLFLHLNKI